MSEQNQNSAGQADAIKQLGLFAAIASLSYVFWVVGAMEMVERLAYYGVKAVATLYATDPTAKGGLGMNASDFGNILLVWALVQSIVPVFTGGLSDIYGYKQTIFASTVVKIAGYLTMAFFPTWAGFTVGAILLALGTAIFKPGIQGTLVKSTTPENSSMAWGIFYQTVNIGGFIGPLVAGYMRKMEWRYVFLACAAIICLNFLLLLTYQEPGKAERLERAQRVRAGQEQKRNLIAESLHELGKPHVWLYLLIFSGFWFMFNALFDVLPLHIQEWVDSSDVVNSLQAWFGPGVRENKIVGFFLVLDPQGQQIQPEGLLNINAGLIMLTCFLFAYLSGRMRATTSMTVGTLAASVALFMSGYAMAGWVSVTAIAIFSVGEMLSSPKFSEFIGNFAPSDKKAMYLGFSQIPLAIGWTAEGKLGPMLYDIMASKERFSREMLAAKGLAEDAIQKIPEGEAFTRLVEFTGEPAKALTAAMAEAHDVHLYWVGMGAIGVLSAAGIYWYGIWLRRRTAA